MSHDELKEIEDFVVFRYMQNKVFEFCTDIVDSCTERV